MYCQSPHTNFNLYIWDSEMIFQIVFDWGGCSRQKARGEPRPKLSLAKKIWERFFKLLISFKKILYGLDLTKSGDCSSLVGGSPALKAPTQLSLASPHCPDISLLQYLSSLISLFSNISFSNISLLQYFSFPISLFSNISLSQYLNISISQSTHWTLSHLIAPIYLFSYLLLFLRIFCFSPFLFFPIQIWHHTFPTLFCEYQYYQKSLSFPFPYTEPYSSVLMHWSYPNALWCREC